MKNYFKKILVMFVMVLTIIGVGAIQSVIIANAATDDGVIGVENLNNTSENSARIEDKLENPEIGWKRYDNVDENILYKDMTQRATLTNGPYKGTDAWGGKNSSLNFKFYGTKLRVIGINYKNASNNVEITIDGNSEVLDCSKFYGGIAWQILQYEKTDLSLGTHEVTITNLIGNEKYYYFDAIDIDENGHLLSVNEEDVNQSISLNKSSLSLKEGASEKLTATTTPSAVDVTWSSSDETIATVDSNGNVKAIKEGQATITAQIKGTDIKTNCIVTVTKEDKEPEPTDPEQEYIINTAYAKGDNTNNASGQVSIIFKRVTEAQLKVVKTADVDSVYVGDNFTYTIEVTNTSDKTAKSVVINDSAPNHIQFIPSGVTTTQGTIDSSSTSKSIIVNVGDIPPLGTVTIKIPVLVVE
ncbi:Ig-like domain-containing protein [uncultured Clostridium sp.]|uniref:Ig-like domain-containing protein n=1 Tax=uncultured Clostridium sp. TaxID=59620 RepID=UPI0028F07660|nr:Ig-like domain-containing protein [uncultured Clostridium sp.]